MVSLNDFFTDTPQATLNSCDAEQIHLSGAIQAIGALLVVSADDMTVLATTPNIKAFIGASSDTIVGDTLHTHAPTLAKELSDRSFLEPMIHTICNFTVSQASGADYETVAFLSGSQILIEFLPAGHVSAQHLRSKLRETSRFVSRIQKSETIEDAYQVTCSAVRQLLGFARVKIYRFRSDWSGIVEAESRADHMPSYLGLNFPDTDIPKQARALFQLVPFRAIASVHDAVEPILQGPMLGPHPVDLSHSLLRSASTMHTAYLRNMGVGASFSLGLTIQDRLWGMIACHHDEPISIPFDYWSLARDLGDALRIRIEVERERETIRQLQELRTIETELSGSMRAVGNVDEVMARFAPRLCEFLNSDGFIFKYGNEIHVAGKVPPPEFVARFIEWVSDKSDVFGQYQTNALAKEWPEAAEHIDTACGVLIQPVMMHRVCHMIWFRAPKTEGVAWAGALTDKSAGTGETANLLPRNSFETWVSSNNDSSQEWTAAEIVAAREMLKEVLDIIAALMVLSDEVTSLKSLTTAAVHDISAPLRGIDYALEMLRDMGVTSDDAAESLEIATLSTKRLAELTKSLLDFVWIKEEETVVEDVDLGEVATEVIALLNFDITKSEATIKVSDLPTVIGSRNLLTRVFMNLIGNAIKYRDPEHGLVITLSASTAPKGKVDIAFSDNGLGIDPSAAERVFAPLVRLHLHDDISGSGLGLSICRRIVERHEGLIWFDTNTKEGAKCVMRLRSAS